MAGVLHACLPPSSWAVQVSIRTCTSAPSACAPRRAAVGCELAVCHLHKVKLVLGADGAFPPSLSSCHQREDLTDTQAGTPGTGIWCPRGTRELSQQLLCRAAPPPGPRWLVGAQFGTNQRHCYGPRAQQNLQLAL